MNLIASLIVLIASFTFGAAYQEPLPVEHLQCEFVAPGADDAEVDGNDFYAWRDVVVEDGELDYSSNGAWTLTHWDGTVELLGFSEHEDSDIWSEEGCVR